MMVHEHGEAALDPVQPPESPDTHGIPWRLQAIFFEPSAALEAINLRPLWIVPIIACVLLSVLSSAVVFSKVDMQELTLQLLRDSPATSSMSDDEIRELARQQATMSESFRWIMPILITPILVFALSGLVLLLVYLSGSESGFWKIVGVVSWSFFAYSLVSSVLTILVYSLSADPQSINIQNPLYTNLGHFIDHRESPVLNAIVSRIDLLTFYLLVLLGLGLSKVATKMSAVKGFVLAAVPYVIYVAIVVFFTALMP